MKLINNIFPLTLHLNILQLEEYKISRFIKWNIKNLFTRKVEVKKQLIYTPKLKNIMAIYFSICFLSLFINIFLFALLLLEPFIGLSLAVLILKPYEFYYRQKTIKITREKILSFKNLKVVGITGSFGKTTTKEILYQMLKNKYKLLRTPESYNTVFGIAKVVELELDKNYDIFICEMAAYKKDEIKTLCEMIPPDYGILTGITTQHFERFGSLANTIKAKFELIDAISQKDNIVFNTDDENILHELRKRNITPTKNFTITNIKFTKNGSLFTLDYKNKDYPVQTSLFGFSNIKNIELASEMCLKLGLSIKEIVATIKTLKPADNRMVLSNDKNSTIVNNTYSSNIQSFKETIETAKLIKGKKVLITPGIVELGSLEIVTHKNLGKLADRVFDKVILVGKNQRTQSLATGLEKNFEFIEDKREDYFKKLEDLKNKFDWIFLENDITQNY